MRPWLSGSEMGGPAGPTAPRRARFKSKPQARLPIGDSVSEFAAREAQNAARTAAADSSHQRAPPSTSLKSNPVSDPSRETHGLRRSALPFRILKRPIIAFATVGLRVMRQCNLWWCRSRRPLPTALVRSRLGQPSPRRTCRPDAPPSAPSSSSVNCFASTSRSVFNGRFCRQSWSGLRWAVMAAIAAESAAGSTGFGACAWNPAARARARSSARA